MKLKHFWVGFFLIFTISFLLTGCAKNSSEEELSEIRTNFLMGTMVTVKVHGPEREKAADEIIDEMDRLEKLMSVNIEESEVSKVNKNAGISPVKVSNDTFKVIKTAYEFAEKTGGLFDPTIGPLVNLWGIGTKKVRVPSKEEIENVLPLINYKKIILDEKEQTVFLTDSGMMIDVGGIAKGYAADRAIDIFKKYKVKSGYVNIGGNVIVHGRKPDKSLWRIGLQDPRSERGDLMGVVNMNDLAVVTSGDYERYIIRDGIRYHHIFNPKTGYPVQAGLISASILGKNSMIADALSTSVFLLGAEKGQALAEKEGYNVILITEEKKVIMSLELEERFEIINEEYRK